MYSTKRDLPLQIQCGPCQCSGKHAQQLKKRKKSGILDFEKETQENDKNVRRPTVSEGIQLAKVSTGKSPTSNIFAQECGRTVHIHRKLCNLELCVINE